jgi:hypothetical protein
VEYEITSTLGAALRCGETGFFTASIVTVPCADTVERQVPDFVSYAIQDLGEQVYELYPTAGGYNHTGARALTGYPYLPYRVVDLAERVAPAKAKGRAADKKAAQAAQKAFAAACGTEPRTGVRRLRGLLAGQPHAEPHALRGHRRLGRRQRARGHGGADHLLDARGAGDPDRAPRLRRAGELHGAGARRERSPHRLDRPRVARGPGRGGGGVARGARSTGGGGVSGGAPGRPCERTPRHRRHMLAALRRFRPAPAAAARLAGLAAGLAGLLLAAAVLVPPLPLVVLALALAACLTPVARAAAGAPGAPRVRVRPDAPDGARPVRLGLRRRRASAAAGWSPSAWDPRDLASWTPDSDRPA